MKWISWILNFPYTVFGIIFGLVSIPKNISFVTRKDIPVIVIKTRTLKTVFTVQNVKGVTFGASVLRGPHEDAGVLEHELIHVEQYIKYPLIFPLLYAYQVFRYGYRQAPFEDEAYTRAGNRYGQ